MIWNQDYNREEIRRIELESQNKSIPAWAKAEHAQRSTPDCELWGRSDTVAAPHSR